MSMGTGFADGLVGSLKQKMLLNQLMGDQQDPNAVQPMVDEAPVQLSGTPDLSANIPQPPQKGGSGGGSGGMLKMLMSMFGG